MPVANTENNRNRLATQIADDLPIEELIAIAVSDMESAWKHDDETLDAIVESHVPEPDDEWDIC